MKAIEQKAAEYERQIRKVGDLNLLAKARKAQEEAGLATKKARELYKEFVNSQK